MKLAIYQGSGTPGDIQANLREIASIIQQASQRGADLLVFPELFLTGYNIGEAMKHLAQPVDSPVLQAIAQLAQEAHLAVLIGYPERCQEHYYNAAILLDADGNTAANYRKIHLFGAAEQRMFEPGDRGWIGAIAGVQVGILICYDVEFPEAVRALALEGAELVVVPTALMAPYTQIADQIVPVRALENQIFVAYANRVGTEGEFTYCGRSCVISPDGTELCRAGTDAVLLMATVDRSNIERSRQASSYLRDRRPQVYGAMLQRISLG